MNKIIFTPLFLMIFMLSTPASAKFYSYKVVCSTQYDKDYCESYSGKPIKGGVVVRNLNGTLASKGNFNNGYRSGRSRFYNERGVLERVSSYSRGIKNGRERWYYPNGKLWLTAKYRKGELVGDVKLNNLEGKKNGQLYYYKGKLKKGYCIDANRKKHNLTAEEIAQQPYNALVFCEE